MPMSDSDLVWLPAHRLAALIAARQLSPVELADAVIARAEAVNPQLNCFATALFDEARAAARRAEATVMRGVPLGPLHGVPVTVKDGVASDGHPMTNGSFALEHNVARSNAIAWQRLSEAGAVLLGKTAAPEFFHKILTDSLIYGVTRSPWSPAHTPGGSSGGAAAALAAGIAPIAIGSDGGGSIRCPASYAGVLGLKPTLGRIPHEGFAETFGNYSFLGPMTRDVRDLELMLAAMSGPSMLDAHSLGVAPLAATGSRPPSARGLRIGWLPRFGGAAVNEEVAMSCEAAMRALEGEGAVVTEFDDPIFAPVFDTYVVIATTAHAARIGPLVDRHGARMTDSMKASVEQGRGYSAADLVSAMDRRTALYRAVQPLFDRFDLLATPTMTDPAPTVDAGGAINTPFYADCAKALYPFNLTGHPAASIPCGFTRAGLPIGLQIVAPWYEERRILDLAYLLEAKRPWAERRPPL